MVEGRFLRTGFHFLHSPMLFEKLVEQHCVDCFNNCAEATFDELLLERLHNMKTSIILSWAFSIIALTLVSCTSTSGTDTTTTRQTTGQTSAQTTAQITGMAPAMPPPTQSSMGGR